MRKLTPEGNKSTKKTKINDSEINKNTDEEKIVLSHVVVTNIENLETKNESILAQEE